MLVAQADRVDADLLGALVEAGGGEPIFALDGERALALAESDRPALVLADLALPRRDGLALLLHLRAREDLRALPVVFVSAEPADEYGPIAVGLGAAAYIEKPWDDGEVLGAISAALEREASERDRGPGTEAAP